MDKQKQNIPVANYSLVTTDHLRMPHIGGTVTVTLEEMDRLRADHAAAVNLARELESKQAMVKIVVMEERRFLETQYHGSGRNQIATAHDRSELFQKSVEYKGFDEFREIIRQEEFKKLKKEFADMSKSLEENKKTVVTQTSDIDKLITERTDLRKKLEDANKDLTASTEQLKKNSEDISVLTGDLLSAQVKVMQHKKAFDELVDRKITLWYWLKTKFTDIHNLK